MKTHFFLLLCSCSSLIASESSRKEYLELVQTHPEIVMPLGNCTKGEIEIVLDPNKMEEIEKASGRDVGILHSDRHWLWVNDACRFPGGHEGVIGRIVSRSLQRKTGAAVLTLLPDDRVVLNCEFRHTSRDWELEMPRGGVKPGESLEDTARREVLEETGFVIDKLVQLGEVTTDSGVTSMILAIFMAKVTGTQKPERESSEAINQTLALSLPEIKAALEKGYVDCVIEGEIRRVNARDPFLAYALNVYSAIKFK